MTTSTSLKLKAEKEYNSILSEFIVNVIECCPIDYWKTKAEYAMINAKSVKAFILNENKCDSHTVSSEQQEKKS